MSEPPLTSPSLSLSWWRALALSALVGVGLWVSDLLVLEHLQLKLGDESDHGVCGASSLFSCKAAAASAFGSIGELPIAAIGEAYYLTALISLVLAFFTLRSAHQQTSARAQWGSLVLSALTGASMLGLLYSLFLAVVSALYLGVFCPLCLGLYAVNITSALLLWRSLEVSEGGRARPWLGQWAQLWRRPAPWLMALLMTASVTAAQGAYATRYNSALKTLKRSQLPPVHVDVSADGPRRGEGSAAVVVEFSDFQCPFCRRFTRQLKQAFEELQQEEGGRYTFSYVFKHYPISSQCNPKAPDMHPRACHAAAAAICAEEQGKFWEMHDLLFERQDKLEDSDLGEYARALELDMSAFVECLPSERVVKRLRGDLREGRAAKVRGTPAFYINGWRFSGAVGVAKIKSLVKRYAYGVLEPAQPAQADEPSPAPSPDTLHKHNPSEAR